MIKLLDSGIYKLVGTKDNLKTLTLDDKDVFLWKSDGGNCNLEYIKFNTDQTCCLLSINNYRLYDVKDEPGLTTCLHLELCIGKRKWQAYLLKNGFPTKRNKEKPFLRKDEIITKVRRKSQIPHLTSSLAG